MQCFSSLEMPGPLPRLGVQGRQGPGALNAHGAEASAVPGAQVLDSYLLQKPLPWLRPGKVQGTRVWGVHKTYFYSFALFEFLPCLFFKEFLF